MVIRHKENRAKKVINYEMVYLSVMKLPININLSFSDVSGQIRDGMGNI